VLDVRAMTFTAAQLRRAIKLLNDMPVPTPKHIYHPGLGVLPINHLLEQAWVRYVVRALEAK
jgi:hypothetical protein